ncbi:MAG: hypothetical protein E7055_20810 [Lentisphaerae bacterium]|nr:hypothetical protein [Lentisphaerota bacterium]
MISQEFTPEEKQKLTIAEGIAKSYFPYLGGIFSKLDIRFDNRIETAAVTGSGKLLFNREFFHRLTPGLETAFILAHELLHLAQMIFERGKAFPDQESLNIAHDLLINEQLCDTMHLANPPCNGLNWQYFHFRFLQPPGYNTLPSKASEFSLEEMVRYVVALKNTLGVSPETASWGLPPDRETEEEEEENPGSRVFSNHPFANVFGGDGDDEEKAPSSAPDPAENSSGTEEDEPPEISVSLDMLGEETEKTLFPDEKPEDREKRNAELLEICRSAAAMNAVFSAFGDYNSPGLGSGNCTMAVDIVRSSYVPPWQMAMQRWFDGAAVSKRSWARASRRGAFRSDIILPGRTQECLTIHIVLDTSGSMTFAIPYLLGQIKAFARNVEMEQAHILQCDTEVTKDELVDIDRLDKYQVEGYGGSDMSPAMLRLAEDPSVTSVLVITDGVIDYPPEKEIPYDVLWCLPEQDFGRQFPYGRVIYVPISGSGE